MRIALFNFKSLRLLKLRTCFAILTLATLSISQANASALNFTRTINVVASHFGYTMLRAKAWQEDAHNTETACRIFSEASSQWNLLTTTLEDPRSRAYGSNKRSEIRVAVRDIDLKLFALADRLCVENNPAGFAENFRSTMTAYENLKRLVAQLNELIMDGDPAGDVLIETSLKQASQQLKLAKETFVLHSALTSQSFDASRFTARARNLENNLPNYVTTNHRITTGFITEGHQLGCHMIHSARATMTILRWLNDYDPYQFETPGRATLAAERDFHYVEAELSRATDCRYFTPEFNLNIVDWADRAISATKMRLSM